MALGSRRVRSDRRAPGDGQRAGHHLPARLCLVLALGPAPLSAAPAPRPEPAARRAQDLSPAGGSLAELRDALGDALATDAPFDRYDAALARVEAYVAAPAPDRAPVALDVCDALRELAERDGRDAATRAHVALCTSWVLGADGRLGEAASTAERALEHQGTDNPHAFLLAFMAAQARRQQESFERAGEDLDRAAAILAEGVDPAERDHDALLLLRERVLLLVDLGLPDRALPDLADLRLAGRRALRERDAVGDWAIALLTELVVDLALEDHPDAVAAMEAARATDAFPRVPPPLRDKLALREALARVELERVDGPGDRTGSPASGGASSAPEPRSELERLLGAGRLDQNDRDLAREGLAELLLARGETSAAADLLERWRASSGAGEREPAGLLLEELRLARARGTLEGDVAGARRALEELRRRWHEEVDAWAALPVRPGGVAPLHFAQSRWLVDALVGLHRVARPGAPGIEAAFEDVLRAEGAGSLARSLHAPAVTAQEIRARVLRPGELALLVVPGREGCYAFTLSAEGLALDELPPARELQEAQRDLARELDRVLAAGGAVRTERYEAAVARMEERLFPPALGARLARFERIAVVGSESLGYVPFEALHGTDGRPLGVSHAIRYLPSFAVAAALAARPSPAGTEGVALLCAGDVPRAAGSGEPLEPIPFGRAEADALLAGVAPDQRRVLVGADASPAGLRAAVTGDLGALHLLAHGLVDLRRERPAELLLAADATSDGRLRAPDIEALPACPPLVTVTACGAWRGPRRRGDDGRAHLSGAFLLAGARTVVLPGTAVWLSFLEAFYPRYYRELSAGVDVDEALRRARTALWEEGRARGRDGAVLAAEREDAAAWRIAPFVVHAVGLADPVPGLRSAPAPEAREDPGPVVLVLAAALAFLVFLRRVLRSRGSARGSRRPAPRG